MRKEQCRSASFEVLTLCAKRSGSGRELKSSSCSAIFAKLDSATRWNAEDRIWRCWNWAGYDLVSSSKYS